MPVFCGLANLVSSHHFLIVNILFFFAQVDDFDLFKKRMLGSGNHQPYLRALLFVDNSGADVVLGMLPLARELLQRGTEVSEHDAIFMVIFCTSHI